MLQALRRAGYAVDSSCETGSCGMLSRLSKVAEHPRSSSPKRTPHAGRGMCLQARSAVLTLVCGTDQFAMTAMASTSIIKSGWLSRLI